MTRIGSLCSGTGALDIGLQAVVGGTVAWHVEYDKHPSAVLAHHYPDVPNYGDITATDWTQVEPVDWLTAGYPCQPFSHAGKRKGSTDERHLWPAVAHAISRLRPRSVLLENVRGHLTLGFDAVLADLARLGYDATWGVVRAADAGAPHGRARLFVVATDTRRERHGRGKDAGAVGRLDGDDAGAARERQRARQVAGDRGCAAAADAGRARLGEHAGEPPTEEAGPPGRDEPAGDGARRAATDADGPARGRLQPVSASGAVQGTEVDGWPAQQPGRLHRGGEGAGAVAAADADGAGRSGVAELHRRAVARLDSEHRGHPDGRDDMPDWGAYTGAIRRWERVLGRPAPRPTEPGRRGERLSPVFVQWLMGLPDGWVTDVPGIPRNAMLKMLGNGVVPQQCALAVRTLLAVEAVAA